MHEWLTIVAPSMAAVVPLMTAIVGWRLNECSKLKWEHRHLKLKMQSAHRGGYEVPVLDLFSHRNRVAAGDAPDVFVYDNLPEALRVQISLIWRNALGPYYVVGSYGLSPPNNNEAWEIIHDAVAREHGIFALGSQPTIADRCVTYLLESPSVDKALDLIKFSFSYICKIMGDFSFHDRQNRGMKVSAGHAIDELNERFRRAGVGYQFEDGKLFVDRRRMLTPHSHAISMH